MNTKTKKEYVSIAFNFYNVRLAGQIIDTDSIWSALLRCAPEYSPNYFKRLKSAIAYHQNAIGNGWTAKVVKNTQNPVKVFPEAFPDFTCNRAQSITIEKFYTVLAHLADKDLKAECAALLLIFRTGARPCELSKIVVDDGEIFIEGAKKTEKGNRGADRVIVGITDDLVSDVSSFIGTLKESNKSMDAIRVSIYKAVKELFPKDKKTISLYTIRHQFGANLKASNMSRIEMAYIMGHQSTESISTYGNKKQGVADWIVVKPANSADLTQVRDKSLGKIWNKSKGVEVAVTKKVTF
jgi:integrase